MTSVTTTNGTRGQRRRFAKFVDAVLADDLRDATDAQLSARLDDVRANWGSEKAIGDCAAVVVELADRHLGLRAHPNQILAGLLMCRGAIVELATGEGKTLVSLFPAVYWALAGHGTHVATANDYLARRDAETLLDVYRAAGLSVGVTSAAASPAGRAAAHACDITYGTASQFGFDYLFDQLSLDADGKAMRDRFAIVVDEADAILLDEAVTPLIISGADPRPAGDWARYADVVAGLDADTHATFDEGEQSASLTDEGFDEAVRMLGFDVTHDGEALHHLDAAVKARFLFHRDVDYIVEDGRVVIIDELTGRRQPDRRYNDGMHEAVEAKEGLAVARGQVALASISIQSLFSEYPLLAGMTGTVGNDAEELEKTYGTSVFSVPTHHPLIRADRPDSLHVDAGSKLAGVLDEIVAARAAGRPVLVGCPSVAESETVHRMLADAGIDHALLNAKNPGAEASIVAQAGRPGAVTVTTAMAGRGVDIKLGGWPEGLAAADAGVPLAAGADPGAHIDDEDTRDAYADALAARTAECEAARDQVLTAGGLLVLGTSRHTSRRADDQLRGRSGRQGEPGESVFYLSADDDLVRMFGAENLSRAMAKLARTSEGADRRLSKVFARAQKRVDAKNRESRETLLMNDRVIGAQRTAVYSWRDRLFGYDADELLHWWFWRTYEALEGSRPGYLADPEVPEEADDDYRRWLATIAAAYTAGLTEVSPDAPLPTAQMADEQTTHLLDSWSELDYGTVGTVLRAVLTDAISTMWRDHMVNLDVLEDSIHYRTFAQKNPQVEFAAESYKMFTAAVTGVLIDKAVEVAHANLTAEPVEQPDAATPSQEQDGPDAPPEQGGDPAAPDAEEDADPAAPDAEADADRAA